MFKSSPLSLTAATVGLLALGSLRTAAWAQAIPTAEPEYYSGEGVNFTFGSSTTTTTGVGGQYGTAITSASVSQALSVSATGQAIIPALDAGNYYDAASSGGASLYYFVAVVGPSAGVSVPLTISGLLGATAAGVTGSEVNAGADIRWSLNGSSNLEGSISVGISCDTLPCSTSVGGSVPVSDQLATSQGLQFSGVPLTAPSNTESSIANYTAEVISSSREI